MAELAESPVALDEPASAPVIENERPRELPNVEPEAANDDEDALIPEQEFITVERNGKSFQVPKELEGEFSMQADYTKKTQSVAERAKELETREAALTKQTAANEAELDARATSKLLTAQLKQYENVDFVKWAATEPVDAQQHWMYKEQLRHDLEAAQKTISEAEQTRTQESQRTVAKRFEEAKAFAQSKIPGWSDDVNNKLMAFVQSEGIPPEFIRDNMSPTLVSMLHKAWLGDQAMKRQAAAPKAVPKPDVEPLQTVSPKSATASRPSLMELAQAGRMEEYAAARKAGRTR